MFLGHGGFFKTKNVGQKIMASVVNTPVSVMETAGEGGAWGIALLASYMINKTKGETLDAYLRGKIFAGKEGECIMSASEDVTGYDVFFNRYATGLSIEQAAVDHLV